MSFQPLSTKDQVDELSSSDGSTHLKAGSTGFACLNMIPDSTKVAQQLVSEYIYFRTIVEFVQLFLLEYHIDFLETFENQNNY